MDFNARTVACPRRDLLASADPCLSERQRILLVARWCARDGDFLAEAVGHPSADDVQDST
jgi:hypothetical protein